VTPCSVVVRYQCFRCPCYLHLQGEDEGSMDLEDLELKTGRVTTLNELAHNLMSAFILEIYFILLPYKARHMRF
jgi:hypothetical protein